MSGRICIEDVVPGDAADRYPSKAVVGEHVPVAATVWREGHEAVGASVHWWGPDERPRWERMWEEEGTDRWSAVIVPDLVGPWTFRIEAWGDPWTTWRHRVDARIGAGQWTELLANELEIGARLLDRAAGLPHRGPDREVLALAAARLRATDLAPLDRLAVAVSEPVERLMTEKPLRELVTAGPQRRIWVDRRRALHGSWYEFFPRSTGGVDETGEPVHGTFATATAELERIADLGFDVVYLPPIHPIGEVHRKGRNNSATAAPGDVGSPWAIGSAAGGHDAVHPGLGTIDDFDAFVARARELGLEVALDLALQCAPDHPWVREHPEWFTARPDGTIAHAENPPKQYQDIYPLNFDNAPEALFAEVLRVVLHWAEHGVRIFRVDNPHTKPPDFWHRLIWTAKEHHPDLLFLAEAFTRRAPMYGLARLGFTQSYTYFTWRTSKEELTEFGRELVEHADEFRPNLYVNTPDILHESLQHGGPAMFALRAALAATLSPSWGMYSGYELYESEPLHPGSEEYRDSEKYQLRPRDFTVPGLQPWIRRLNDIRRRHPALRQLRTLRFHHVDDDHLLAYSKTDPATGDTVVCVVNLDPHRAREATLSLDLRALGREGRFTAFDEVSGQSWVWQAENYVRLDPRDAVAHIVTLGDEQ
ncbi:maltotransferase domain-containing protein [Saccharopolyspora rosea]|uniref:Alpha-1,4-glucan:maltose-1-phosphate maltosyltransferase n=1 Tax=Saccharopolyspora rosea TaxID=524884 RepID=A0ABW3FZ62_9PSEU|nr:maltotransferase domain-containing protein [Saccharopolyspora rosea]